MADYRAAWLIGSLADMPEQTITISGSPQSTGSVRGFYLFDAGPNNLCGLMQNIMVAAGLTGVKSYIQRNGYVYLESDAVFTVGWGVNPIMRDMLGFDATLSGAANYTAPYKSPLLWMPGKPETPMMQRLGTVGHKVPTVYQAVAPYSGRAESVSHGSRTYARYLFPMVDTDLVVTAANEGGTWARWFDEVAVKAARFKLYREVLEGPTNTLSALAVLDQPLGPYVMTNTRNGPAWSYEMSKGFERTDKRADIDFKCHLVEEYT